MIALINRPIFLIAASVGLVLITALAGATALDDYVAAPDPAYTFSIADTTVNSGYTTYLVAMTSQTWRSSAEVNHTVWTHWLTVFVPDEPTNTTALLVVNGGDNGDAPMDLEPYAGMLVTATGSVMALLEQVPNQPLRFTGASGSFSEDRIIAYSYDKYLTTGDPTWPALLPMVKSAVRAMDTVQAVASAHDVTVDGFVVGGGSKRGWTTWLTAAVDPRVVAFAPIVIDILNMAPQMDHHYKAYGAYSDAVHDYVDYNIFDRIDTPEGAALRQIVDPYEYRARYTMPKYIINATGDEFFLLDGSQFYYDDLPGEKRLRYVPNSGHSVEVDFSSILSLATYYLAVATDVPRPEYAWTFEEDGSIRVQTVQAASSATLWQASNPSARDFRWYGGAGPQWTSTSLAEETPGSGVYVGQVDPPEQGWSAFFISLSYSDGFVFTTAVRVIPDGLPYEDLDGDGDVNIDDDDDDGDGIPDATDIAPWDAAPTINPAIPDLETEQDDILTLVLTPYEHDAEDGHDRLAWAVEGGNPALFSAGIAEETDELTVTPVPDAEGQAAITLVLSDSKGQTASQEVLITVKPASALTLTSPNGGEVWRRGREYAVTWTSRGDAIGPDVKLSLYRDGSFLEWITNRTANDGLRNWFVPEYLPEASDYAVRIQSFSNAAFRDFSNKRFTISGKALTVTVPNGGEIWRRATPYAISWVGDVADVGPDVKISLYRGGAFVDWITRRTENDGLRNWTVPDNLPDGDDYTIAVRSFSYGNIRDDSDGPFNVIGRPIEVTSPNGGETWTRGGKYAVTWNSDPEIGGDVKIAVYRDGAFLYWITKRTGNGGLRYWTIPPNFPTGSGFKVWVCSYSKTAFRDMSNAPFSVE
ncbi:MAG TPA: PhoPQ-activated protein PqaA family protein [Candidatus Hydrogenedentes bacterium]|nr:PhoPQ-activated protein PqaA family protein [Candidatus Hydrogenedentota bacterium]HPG69217.1 PhoPQ-activated protein PqaA family protein [Candidatus Hydrogenedentota bacterium]